MDKADMVIAQKRGSTKIRYAFHADRLDYALDSSDVGRTFSVEYTGISRDRESLTEKGTWYRNLGFFWMTLGVLLMVVSWTEPGGSTAGAGWMWLCVGVGSYAFYRRGIKRFVVLPCERGNLLLLDDASGRRIIDEIERRRAARLRADHDFFPDDEPPEQLRRRFEWLRQEGALSDEEWMERASRVDAMELLSRLEANPVDGRPED